jgi:DNA-binding protein Fis
MSQSAAETSSLFASEPSEVPQVDQPERTDDLETFAAKLVGLSGVEIAQARVKRAMLREALVRTNGNFTKTAYLLGVRRQAVQQMVVRFDLRHFANAIRRTRDD